jgi:hypothetical protein
VYADLLATRPGDFVFFYQRRVDEAPTERGFRGIYRVAGPPFVDRQPVDFGGNRVLGECPHCKSQFSEKIVENKDGSHSAKCPNCKASLNPAEHILPNRLPLELVTYYGQPVDDNSAYIDRTDPGSLWTLIFRKQYGAGRERSINHMLPEEGLKIERLLAKANAGKATPTPSGFLQGYPNSYRSALPFQLQKKTPFTVESILYAWLNQNVDADEPVLRSILGPPSAIEYFGNQVLYGIGGDTADYLVLHTKRSGENPAFEGTSSTSFDKSVREQEGRFAVTVIEIKKNDVDLDTLKQVDRYAYYVAQVATANCLPAPPRNLLVQPVLLGFSAAQELLQEVKRRSERRLQLDYPGGASTHALVTPAKVLTYGVHDGRLNLTRVV